MAGADPFDDWQVEALLAAAARRSKRESAWVTLLVQTGFRPRELLNCRVFDAAVGTTVRQILHIKRSRLKGGKRCKVVTGRTVPLCSASIAALKPYLCERAGAHQLDPRSPLFPSRHRSPLSLWRANAILKKLIREAGFEGAGKFSLHSGPPDGNAGRIQASGGAARPHLARELSS